MVTAGSALNAVLIKNFKHSKKLCNVEALNKCIRDCKYLSAGNCFKIKLSFSAILIISISELQCILQVISKNRS